MTFRVVANDTIEHRQIGRFVSSHLGRRRIEPANKNSIGCSKIFWEDLLKSKRVGSCLHLEFSLTSSQSS